MMRKYLQKATLIALELTTYSIVSLIWFFAVLAGIYIFGLDDEGIYNLGPEISDFIYSASSIALLISCILWYTRRNNREALSQSLFEDSLKK